MVKKKILLFLFSISSLVLFSQKTVVDFSLGSGIRNFGLSNVRPTGFLNRNSTFEQTSYFSANLGIRLAKINRYSIHFISAYSVDKYKSTIAGLRFPSDLATMPITYSKIITNANFSLASVEFSGRYNLAENIHKQLLLEIGVGGSFPLTTKGDAIIFYGNGAQQNIINSIPEIKKVSIFTSLGAYFKYSLSPKISLLVNPMIKHYFKGIGETFINAHRIDLNSFEMNIGVSKKIK